MANTIRLKRGTTEPTAGVLVTGEVAINTTNGNAYTLTDAGDVVQIGASSISLEATVRNETGSPLTKGQVVYLNGASGNKALAVLAQANGEATSSGTYGLVKADIANNNNGTVVIAGFINKLNTEGYTDGDKIYLSPTVAGGWTTTKPSAPNHMVFLGTITYAHQTQGAIQLRIANGFELEELHNVSIGTTPANGDVLTYELSTGLWKNQAPAGGGSWGSITGTLSSQTDLQNALDAKANLASPALTGNVTITANSTSPALSVIQTGTGDVIQLRDVASDTTYSFVDQNGKINTVASQTATAGFRIPSGSAPTTPVAGDFWNASGSLYLYHGTTAFQIPSLNATTTTFTGTTFAAGQVASGNATVNLATQNHASGASKTIAIGTSGLSGSTTTINVGSGTAGTSTIEIGSTGGTSTTNLRGTVTATTQATSDNSTKVATTAFVKNQPFLTATTGISSNVGGSGGTEIGYIQLYNNGVAGSEIYINPYAYDFATATYQVIELSVTEPDPVNASYFTTAIQGKGIRFPDGTIQTTAGGGSGGVPSTGGTFTGAVNVNDPLYALAQVYFTPYVGDDYANQTGEVSASDSAYQTTRLWGSGIKFNDGTLQTTAGIGDAPADGTIYGRQNNSWVVAGGSFNGGTITSALTINDGGGMYPSNSVVLTNDNGVGESSITITDAGGTTQIYSGYIQTNALYISGNSVATQSWVGSQGYVSSSALGNGNATAGALVIDALKNANAPSSTNQFATEGDVNSAVNSLATQITTQTAATYAPKASPALTGTPLSTTAAADTNTTQIATTAFVVGQAGTATPLANNTAAVGTSLRYARQDHIHPTDTTRAALAGATFTGLVSTPASTTSSAGFRINGGVAPTSPTNGDIWSNGTDIQVRLNGVTETVAEQSWVTAQGYLTSAPVTSVAGQTGAVTLSNTDISGLGTMATETAANYSTTTVANGLYYPLTGNPSNFLTSAPVASVAGKTGAVSLVVGDVSGAAALSGATFTGRVITPASTTNGAGFNLSPAPPPTSPSNGDLWATSVSMQMRNNGVTSTIASTADITSALGQGINTTLTLSLANGATSSGNTKNVSIGTNGLAGSTTNITIGATAGTSTTTLNGTVNAGTVTATTQAAGTNNTTVATTAFVRAAMTVKAWVRFNGTGTVAINASFNVSSITDNGVGLYFLNFTTGLADANYAVATSCSLNTLFARPVSNSTAAGCRIQTANTAGSLGDDPYIGVIISR